MSEADMPIAGIVFSLIGNEVWASWPGAREAVVLGSCDEVTYMMRDFLAQCDFAERLTSRASSNG